MDIYSLLDVGIQEANPEILFFLWKESLDMGSEGKRIRSLIEKKTPEIATKLGLNVLKIGNSFRVLIDEYDGENLYKFYTKDLHGFVEYIKGESTTRELRAFLSALFFHGVRINKDNSETALRLRAQLFAEFLFYEVFEGFGQLLWEYHEHNSKCSYYSLRGIIYAFEECEDRKGQDGVIQMLQYFAKENYLDKIFIQALTKLYDLEECLDLLEEISSDVLFSSMAEYAIDDEVDGILVDLFLSRLSFQQAEEFEEFVEDKLDERSSFTC